jgi:hypothetical protein
MPMPRPSRSNRPTPIRPPSTERGDPIMAIVRALDTAAVRADFPIL